MNRYGVIRMGASLLYGLAMAATGTGIGHPAFWIGIAFAMTMSLTEFLEARK